MLAHRLFIKSYLLKVEIKTPSVEKDREKILIYVTFFKTLSPEAPLGLLITTTNIIKGQILTTFPEMYVVINNLLTREALYVSKQQYKLTNNFYFPKVLQQQKMYLRRGLFNTQDVKIRDFICRVNEMTEYLKHFTPLERNQ